MTEINKPKTNKYKSYIDFMLSQQQWSGITKEDVDNWLNNFKGLNPTEMLLVYKLLANLIYYSEKDIISALKEGINNNLFQNIILQKQKDSCFNLSIQALSNIVKDELQKSCFTPLLDSGKPHESANYIARLLVQQGFIDQKQSLFLADIVTPIMSGVYTRLVIVDDCIGSGNQLRTFLRETAKVMVDDVELNLCDFCKQHNIIINYLALFGYKKSICELKEEMNDLNIFCVRILTDKHRVFKEGSYIWEDIMELEAAKKLFRNLTDERQIPLLGYKDLDFAFVMHQTMPDWSLPLFWKTNQDWNLLFRRKNSNA